MKRKAPHHRGNYQVRAARCRAAADANPATRCRRCGLTLAEGIAAYGRGRARWTAGHVNDGEIGGPLAPEHACCNYSAGAAEGNARRNPNSEQW